MSFVSNLWILIILLKIHSKRNKPHWNPPWDPSAIRQKVHPQHGSRRPKIQSIHVPQLPAKALHLDPPAYITGHCSANSALLLKFFTVSVPSQLYCASLTHSQLPPTLQQSPRSTSELGPGTCPPRPSLLHFNFPNIHPPNILLTGTALGNSLLWLPALGPHDRHAGHSLTTQPNHIPPRTVKITDINITYKNQATWPEHKTKDWQQYGCPATLPETPATQKQHLPHFPIKTALSQTGKGTP